MKTKSKLLHLAALCLSALFIFGACTSCAPTLNPSKTYNDHKYASAVENMAESVVAVLLIKDNKIRLIGSAVVTKCEKGKPIRLFTAAHVPNAITELGGPTATILIGSMVSKRFQQVKVIVDRSGQDLDVLEGFVPEEQSCSSVPVASTLPELGSPVWLVGNPMGHEKNITKGVLSNTFFSMFFKDKPLVYRTDAACGPGNSGGGLFNFKGELIGILSFTEITGFFAPLPGGCHAIALPHLWAAQTEADNPKKETPAQSGTDASSEKR